MAAVGKNWQPVKTNSGSNVLNIRYICKKLRDKSQLKVVKRRENQQKMSIRRPS
jgi:hypothetical protein